MKIWTLVVIPALCSIAATASDKPNFSGTWLLKGPDQGRALKIEQNGDQLRIWNAADGQKSSTEISCNTMGKQCEATVDGEKVKVSFWYNGDTLIELIFRGKDGGEVTKNKRTLSEDKNTMLVEVMPMTPPGKSAEHLTFVRDSLISEAAPQTPHQ
jgi:hypothetical protein